METTYKGCDINIKLLSIKDGLIGYEYCIIVHKGNHSFDQPFSGTINYVGDNETINHILIKAQKWIDDYLGD
ncbi:MAG: hypothetical protein COW04_06200 [Deltaproteobacteria bacterium CG12_big_fil_rev_8_21_14_0_65_43_10]|nr:MAG: hypothetical protein AUK23_01830 [Deltaproteobacteria bacterium CG2_30_43_15]PIQ45692.1 MAG: hypothetical protein COW04_06200 [Deltaproteobacteria bacterium CG12_big_fil_rev_8_21_14_0_65_43_10]PIU86729.1 MAG: hypothetical protein COS67_01010 [Deltaproteobacteria bacterium CG06_land_8_20_14_3_00_44_19]PIX24622.1 MAG: hypothetical protein COZ68_05900 [Deltaproteobacteria bacterium CG_4_8_14_3_um_filter_43_13]PIZ19873.1 MAG: hypothetical protein COY50_07715 [Deltaproteobacteria bacterium C